MGKGGQKTAGANAIRPSAFLCCRLSIVQAFLEQISQKREEAECLCDDTQAEGCFFSWHNWRDKDVNSNSGPLSVEKYRKFYEKQKEKLELAASVAEKQAGGADAVAGRAV